MRINPSNRLTFRDSMPDKDRNLFDWSSKFVFVGGIMFAVLAAGLFPVAIPTYAAVLLSLAGVGLGLRGIADLPNTKSRRLLYLAGVAAMIALTAAIILTASALSLGLVIGVTAILVASYAVAANFLTKPHSQMTKLPLLTNAGYGLSGLAFVGLTVAFSLMAAGVLPSFLLLPLLLGGAFGVAVFTSLVTACTPAPRVTTDLRLPGSAVSSAPSGESDLGWRPAAVVPAITSARPALNPSYRYTSGLGESVRPGSQVATGIGAGAAGLFDASDATTKEQVFRR